MMGWNEKKNKVRHISPHNKNLKSTKRQTLEEAMDEYLTFTNKRSLIGIV